MSDEATTPSKRGRKSTAEKTEKVESKKRPRKEIKQADSGDEDGAAAPKRGRGRPKGTTKKKAAPKAKGKSGPGRRGRPKKSDKGKASSEEDNEEDDAEEEDDD